MDASARDKEQDEMTSACLQLKVHRCECERRYVEVSAGVIEAVEGWRNGIIYKRDQDGTSVAEE